jgi:hypothetical protein
VEIESEIRDRDREDKRREKRGVLLISDLRHV